MGAKIISTHTNLPVPEIENFARAFLYSGLNSIDAFLAKQPKFVESGKLVIASLLCRRESAEAIVNLTNQDDWYRALWNALSDDVSDPDFLARNKLKIVTFNYDRSLEYSLYERIRNSFEVDNIAAQHVLTFFPILHVYGQLGGLRFSDKLPGRFYTPEISYSALKTASDGIQIIPEARDDSPTFQQAREWFEEAERICFLGFGFDRLNVQRLGLQKAFEKMQARGKHRPPVFATVYQRTQTEIAAIAESLQVSAEKWIPLAHTNLQALRHTRILM